MTIAGGSIMGSAVHTNMSMPGRAFSCLHVYCTINHAHLATKDAKHTHTHTLDISHTERERERERERET